MGGGSKQAVPPATSSGIQTWWDRYGRTTLEVTVQTLRSSWRWRPCGTFRADQRKRGLFAPPQDIRRAVYHSVCDFHAPSMNVYFHFGRFPEFSSGDLMNAESNGQMAVIGQKPR